MIRFLHTADWQIGKPFGGYGEAVRNELRIERFRAVERLAAMASGRGADFVLVAGDVFDGNTVADRDVLRTLEAMSGFRGPWILLPGNHDASLSASVWTRLADLRPPANIRPALLPEPIALLEGRVAVLPAPLTRRQEGADVTTWFDGAPTPPGAFRIGLAHGSVEGRLPAKAEAPNPIHPERAGRARLDYLALGDWHGFLRIAPRTFYSGTPEPDRYPQNEPGFAALVEIDAPGAEPRVERLATGRFRWRSLRLDLDGGAEAFEEAMAALESPSTTLLDLALAGTLTLRGRADLDAGLQRWRSRLFDLRLRDDDLADAPDGEDFDRMEAEGFVGVALERLRRKAGDPADPERAAAALALRRLFSEHARLRRAGL